MLIDTHAHLNLMIKKEFDVALSQEQIEEAQHIVTTAAHASVHNIINVGTSVIESRNSILLAQHYAPIWASVGIHPNDSTDSWKEDLIEIEKMIRDAKRNKVVALGECGLDFYRPGYNKQRQYDVFKAHIEYALQYALPLVIHSRQAADETLHILEQYVPHARGIIHCFSQDRAFAKQVIAWGYVLGIGGTITYPKNEELRQVVRSVPLTSIVLETDAPYLPPQAIRGKENHPAQIHKIALYIAQLRGESYEHIAHTTTMTARALLGI